MKKPPVNDHNHTVRKMFSRISQRYDLLNRLMTLGQDCHWRSEAINRLDITSSGYVLDIGCGTGDIALEIARRCDGVHILAADFTPEMITIGRRRPGSKRVNWIIADALQLPFRSAAFQGVISGFLLRNVTSVPAALAEQARLCQPGGRLAVLDTTRPRPSIFFPLVQFHFKVVIPWLGRLVSGDAQAYHYLPETTSHFLTAETLAQEIEKVGYKDVGFVRRMLGTIAVHWARKPSKPTNR